MAPDGNEIGRWHFYDATSTPKVFDIVLCKFPFEEDTGNPPVGRCSPCLVKRVRVHKGGNAAFVTVAFGTTNLNIMHRTGLDLIIQNAATLQKTGLSKATRFDLSSAKTADLPWSAEWFPIPNGRLTPVIGALDDALIALLIDAVKNRTARGI